MRHIRILLSIVGLIYGASGLALADERHHEVTFKVTDVPGHWFDTGADIPAVPGTRSLVIIAPGDTAKFHQIVESRHTITSLVWPSDATKQERIDQDAANTDDHEVTLRTPGLYVYVCKLHPYMLGAVIVDDKTTDGLDIGKKLTLLVKREVMDSENLTFDSFSNLTLRLLRAFFIVTNPSNWKDYSAANVGNKYQPTYPNVPVRVYSNGNLVTPSGSLPLLGDAIVGLLAIDGQEIPRQLKPSTKGVGEVWVDTQFELTDRKADKFPGTMSVVEVDAHDPAKNWEVKKKIALPNQKMNNGHNLWPSHNQEQVYQTEWHGKSVYVLDRRTGTLLQELEIGHDPAHVMTRVDTEQVHVGLNGEDGVVEMNRLENGLLEFNRLISMQDPQHPTKQTQPHAHWMGFDGKHMVTPNSNSADSTLYEFIGHDEGKVLSKEETGAVSIATGMMPDSSKYYVSNYLGHSISVMNGPERKSWYGQWYAPGAKIKDISLIKGYHPVTGCGTDCVSGLIGGLPVQTPVSPDGRFVIIGNTLGGTIAIIRTSDDTLVKLIPCDPGCHGVNFGAKKGGGYYAYVTSKFANRMIVLDYDPDNDGDVSDAEIAGWVILANNSTPSDDAIAGNYGQGGQGVMPTPMSTTAGSRSFLVPGSAS